MKTIEEIHSFLDSRGIKRYGRNKIVAEKTGYSPGMVGNVLSGHVALTARFLSIFNAAFDKDKSDTDCVSPPEQPRIAIEKRVTLHGSFTASELIEILYGLTCGPSAP